MFCLTQEEKQEVITNCDNPGRFKFSPSLPYAFTEQGVAMLSTVLRSQRAIEVNIAIMRSFVKLRALLVDNVAIRTKLEEHDEQIKYIFGILEQMLEEPERPKNK